MTQHLSQPNEDSLVDALDRLLDTGASLSGDVTISVGGVDLIEVSLAALIQAVSPSGPKASQPHSLIPPQTHHSSQNK